MMKPYCIVDVDLTVVDSVTGKNGWLDWLNAKTDRNDTAEELGFQYNLAKHFQQHWHPLDTETPMDWWRYAGIYDTMKPIENSVRVLEEISNTHDIIFVSHCKGSHMKSKYMFLKRHFGHIMKGFLATKEKHLVASMKPHLDIIIDDRHEHLNKFANRRLNVIKYNTPWSQFESLNPSLGTVVAIDWNNLLEIYSCIKFQLVSDVVTM